MPNGEAVTTATVLRHLLEGQDSISATRVVNSVGYT